MVLLYGFSFLDLITSQSNLECKFPLELLAKTCHHKRAVKAEKGSSFM